MDRILLHKLPISIVRVIPMSDSSALIPKPPTHQEELTFVERFIEISDRIGNLDEFLRSAIDLIHNNFQLDLCPILLTNNNFLRKNRYFLKRLVNRKSLFVFYEQLVSTYQDLLLSGNYLIFPNADAALYKTNKLLPIHSISSIIIMPLLCRGNYYGAICLNRDCSNYQWTQNELKLLSFAANQCAIAIDRHILNIKCKAQQKAIEKLEQQQQLSEKKVQIQQKLIEELQQKQQLSEQNEIIKNEFFANLTHEIRTPLTAILGFSHALIEKRFGDLNGKQMQYAYCISESGKHLKELVDDYLDLTKIVAGKEELELQKIPVLEICQASMCLVEEKAAQTGIELILDIDSNLDFCCADPLRLKQILVNLLSNAVKFTDKGSVTLKLSRDPDWIYFAAIDTGIGIAPHNLDKLFQPFQQIGNRSNNKQKGTGLGLVLSRKLAILHGGDLTVTSQEGVGSCFTLYLPIQPSTL
jgi:signal transduction histidine kinase